MLNRKETIQKSKAVSSISKRQMIQKLQDAPEFVPCADCCAFEAEKDFCKTFLYTVDPYIQLYGCGKGETDVPF